MRTFDSLYEQIDDAFLLSNGCIRTIGQGTCTAKTQTCDVVWVLTKSALSSNFRLERAEALVDDLPNHFVVLHDDLWDQRKETGSGVYSELGLHGTGNETNKVIDWLVGPLDHPFTENASFQRDMYDNNLR